ncbi:MULTISPECIES: NACHT domain-containing protein [Paraburkholderia]|uniref:NACHT domain-containing protein n=1 Tax=Paraburkholderia TaxID=1822464 RepID=UPI0038BAEE8E
MDLKAGLVAAYRRYGFTLARDGARDDVLVFTLKTGYFDNAEIIKLSANAVTENIFKDFSSAGYACTVRDAKSPEQAEEELFNGFFSVDSTRTRLIDDYRRFTSALVQPYGEKAKYEYIRAPYQIDGKEGQKTPPEEVMSRIDEGRPILFLIEAAAGFGKTCTAQEIVQLLANHEKRLPLYAELSRNRQARIFRYILLDEIDRTFPLLSSSLVQTEIKNGRVAAILDGFDELLRKGEESGNFENKEPMLETVSELLTGCAKIIITTRRTVLFDGDEFHQWLDRHAGTFSVVRIRIQEPKINDWLPYDRVERLKSAGLNLDAMANPVLLSYLRCIDESAFSAAANEPETIVQSYFEYMLDRERARQDLRMTVQMQSGVLRGIADDMMMKGYTAEQRDYIIKILLETSSKEIELARSQYATSDRPSREEIANKLASHALLDRSAAEATKIGFVNEFALGNYVAENITANPEWLGDDLRFIDPAVRSYAPRTPASRQMLYQGLLNSMPFLDERARIEVSSGLIGILPEDLVNGTAEGMELSLINVGNPGISSFQFNEVIFKNCRFIKSGLSNVTFLNCRFFDCEVLPDDPVGPIYVLGGASSPEIASQLSNALIEDKSTALGSRDNAIERVLLKRFWPIGDSLAQKPSRPVYKPMKFLCQPIDDFSSAELYNGIGRLLKAGILFELNRSNLIALNTDAIGKAQAIFESVE